ncbi:MAG: hypothetical protein AAGH99_13530 [Planctomycetota bacterium]
MTAVTCLIFLITGVFVIGCEQAPPPIDGKIRIVDPGRPAEETGILLPDRDPVKWLSRRVSLPLEQEVDESWDVINETILDDLSRAVWNGNGLRVGILPAARVPAFAAALGKPLEERDTQILSYSFLEDIRESPPLRAEFTADLTVPPNPVTLETFTKGRLRMLMSSQKLGNGLTRITLVPQHHRPRTTLLPRSPEERILDGRVFDELAVEFDVRPRDVLVLGYYRPATAEPVDETQEVAEEQPTNGESPIVSEPEVLDIEIEEQDTSETDDETILVLNLGIGLFTTGLTEDDLQYLYVLRPLP